MKTQVVDTIEIDLNVSDCLDIDIMVDESGKVFLNPIWFSLERLDNRMNDVPFLGVPLR